MTKRCIIGDNGSPWRSLRALQIRCPGLPLSVTLVLAEERMVATQFLQAAGNPMCSRISWRKEQVNESNTFEMPTLKSRQS
jgi:hypothetical protein